MSCMATIQWIWKYQRYLNQLIIRISFIFLGVILRLWAAETFLQYFFRLNFTSAFDQQISNLSASHGFRVFTYQAASK